MKISIALYIGRVLYSFWRSVCHERLNCVCMLCTCVQTFLKIPIVKTVFVFSEFYAAVIILCHICLNTGFTQGLWT